MARKLGNAASFVGVALALFLLLSACPTWNKAELTWMKDVYRFEDDPTGVPPTGWEESYSTFGVADAYTRSEAEALGVTIKVDDAMYFGGASGKSVHFLDTSTSVGSMIERSFYRLSNVRLEYYMRTSSASGEGVFVGLRGDVGTDYSVVFHPSGYIGVHGWSGGWIKTDLLPFSLNTWYHVVRSLDLATNTGAFVVTEVNNPSNQSSYSVGSNYLNTYVDSVFMITSTSQTTDGHVDEMEISGDVLR